MGVLKIEPWKKKRQVMMTDFCPKYICIPETILIGRQLTQAEANSLGGRKEAFCTSDRSLGGSYRRGSGWRG